MTKKILLPLFMLLIGFVKLSNAQSACPFTKTVTGNTVAFSFMWPITGNMVLDSVQFDFGDATNATYFPPTFTTSHTYAPGAYNCCLTRYLHILNTTTPIICTFCDSIVISGPTSFDHSSEEQISVWPNPVHEHHLNINLGVNETPEYINLIDLTGKKVPLSFQKIAASTSEINVSNLLTGCYMLQVKTNLGHTRYIRFQVQ